MRIEGKGHLLAHGRPGVGFRFDRHRYEGIAGDTLASALMANGVLHLARSFKYHRPRGVVSAGSEEPNGLVTLGRGAGQVPNARATMQEVYPGLEAFSQNAWPGLGVDLLGINDWLSPFLGAGFYYKTFMWPKRAWEYLYEPVIRRAAGMGRLHPEPSARRSEKAFAHCDLLVIGAGPAGLMAALSAARAGGDVILADESAHMGGRLSADATEINGGPGWLWAGEVVQELASLPNVRLMARTTVTGVYDHGTYGAVERVSGHVSPGERLAAPEECFWRIHARRAVLAAGSVERLVAFPGNDRPGILAAGAVRAYLNRYGVAAARSWVVFGNHDEIYATADLLVGAGLHVSAVVDSRPGDDCRARAGYPVWRNAQVCETAGRRGLERVRVRRGSKEEWLQAGALAVSGGWNPNVHLSCHLGARPVWNPSIAAFVPAANAVPGLAVAGAAAGEFSTHAALLTGAQAAHGALGLGDVDPQTLPRAEDTPFEISPLWEVKGRGRAFLDLQTDVTTKDIRLAAQEGFGVPEHMKRYTTMGMGADQGKTGGATALAVLAQATGTAIDGAGTTTYRPPYTPVSIATMGDQGRGAGFAPERLCAAHDAALAEGAQMVEAGLWMRPAYYRREGEQHWRQSCDREVAYVRQAVGVCDVSSLGKIDLQGPDAAALLDLVYTGRLSTLKPGRVRYGVMLREDGLVMDDGPCAHIAPGRYLLTTTTAAAGEVMRHLEFAVQALAPALDVSMVSVSDHWAQYAVAGPHAQDLLASLLGKHQFSPERFSYMGCGEVDLDLGPAAEGATNTGAIKTGHTTRARLFGISFSGEQAWEIAVPARHGALLWKRLSALARAYGGGPYGMEALNVLRIEKGFLTHAEMHGRATACDLGLERLGVAGKNHIGAAMAARPGLCDPARERLVGLRCVGEVRKLVAGASLFGAQDEPVSANAQGYVTSACYSPTLGTGIGLGFIQNGPERYGEIVKMNDHLSGVVALCELCHPVFYDPDGGRMRGASTTTT